jgi:hypothetical protein
MTTLIRGLVAITAAGLLTCAVVSSARAADLDNPRSARPAPLAKPSVKRKSRVVRHRSRHRGPGWIWVRRAHKDHYKYVYREFGSYFARGRPSCWC